jgi:hypothetical protein
VSKWPKDWHPETEEDARRFLDAHENGAGDPDLIDECDRMVESSKSRRRPTGLTGTTTPSPFPKPPNDQLEEEGSD